MCSVWSVCFSLLPFYTTFVPGITLTSLTPRMKKVGAKNTSYVLHSQNCGQGRDILLERALSNITHNELAEIIQITVISCCEVDLTTHLEAGGGGLVSVAVRLERSILVRLLLVSLLNVLWTRGAGKLQMWIFFCDSSRMTMSSFSFVVQMSGGIVPPPVASKPGTSEKTVNLAVSMFGRI